MGYIPTRKLYVPAATATTNATVPRKATLHDLTNKTSAAPRGISVPQGAYQERGGGGDKPRKFVLSHAPLSGGPPGRGRGRSKVRRCILRGVCNVILCDVLCSIM